MELVLKTGDDLQILAKNKIAESLHLEYKLKLNYTTQNDKKEFLKDVSAFANSAGGQIIYGIKESGGVPDEVVGLSEIGSIDETKQTLESLLRDTIKPRIVGLRIEPIALQNGKYCIVVRVPKSLQPPHRVDYSKWDKFFVRNSAGVHPASVEELRDMFMFAHSLDERIMAFRLERIAKIKAKEATVELSDGPHFVLHIIPLASFSPSSHIIDVEAVNKTQGNFAPIEHHGVSNEVNFDGPFRSSAIRENGAMSYTQLFRNGCVEAVSQLIKHPIRRDGEEIFVDKSSIKEWTTKEVGRYLKDMTSIGINPPFVVMVSMLGMKGTKFSFNHFHDSAALDRNNLLVIPQLLNDPLPDFKNADEWTKLMQPTLDAIWNAYGVESCR